jgi:hypothetical protein
MFVYYGIIKFQHINKKKTLANYARVLIKIPGNDLLSRKVSQAVPSALEGLTSLFGMGRGVSPSLWSPEYLQFEKYSWYRDYLR